jgi:hypothetical protein
MCGASLLLTACSLGGRREAAYANAESYFIGLTASEIPAGWSALFRTSHPEGAQCLRDSIQWRSRVSPATSWRRQKALFLTGGKLQATLRYDIRTGSDRATLALVLEEAENGAMEIAKCAWVEEP